MKPTLPFENINSLHNLRLFPRWLFSMQYHYGSSGTDWNLPKPVWELNFISHSTILASTVLLKLAKLVINSPNWSK